MRPGLVQLENVSVALGGRTVLHRLTWRLRTGEHWAVLGSNGSGKSTFLRLVRGELWPAPGCGGRRVYRLDGVPQTSAVGVKERIGMVSPELQERYLRREWNVTALEAICSGFCNSDYLYGKPTARQRTLLRSIIDLLGVGELLRRDVQQLSTGELRRVLIARALAGEPRILVCDEICDGLEARARHDLLRALERVARSGTQLLYTTHRAEEIVPAITHVLVLEAGRVVRQGARERTGRREIVGGSQTDSTLGVFGRTFPPHPGPLPQGEGEGSPAHRRKWRSPWLEGQGAGLPLPKGEGWSEEERNARTQPHLLASARPLIRIEKADVYLQRRRVLRGVNWQMREGEHWAILGGNGAGKSTFLKLILGELQPAHGGTVQRFGLTPRHSVWDLKKRLGYVSTELQAGYPELATGAEVVASGFTSSVGLRCGATRRQRWKVRARLKDFDLTHLAKAPIAAMSYGEVRKLLLLRALVHEPRVLLLDEPFDGLDTRAKAAFNRTLDRVARNGTQLIMVTHRLHDLPRCTTHALLLDAGRIVQQGPLGER